MTICRIAAGPSARYHPPFLLEAAVGNSFSDWAYELLRSQCFYDPDGTLVRRCLKRMKNPKAKTIPVWIMADVCISSRRSLKRAIDELADMVRW